MGGGQTNGRGHRSLGCLRIYSYKKVHSGGGGGGDGRVELDHAKLSNCVFVQWVELLLLVFW